MRYAGIVNGNGGGKRSDDGGGSRGGVVDNDDESIGAGKCRFFRFCIMPSGYVRGEFEKIRYICFISFRRCQIYV